MLLFLTQVNGDHFTYLEKILMKKILLVLTAGFAMFSMFFGSGNLVFPILLGQSSLHHYPWAILGMFLTGVIIPFTGVFGILLYQGNLSAYFARAGKYIPEISLFFILPLIGPFGVIPRCITVAHGGIELIFPKISLWKVSFIICLFTFLMLWNKNRTIEILGKWLAPILLAGLFLIIFATIKKPLPIQTTLVAPKTIFLHALQQGFQTMDLLGAFFFASHIMNYLKSKTTQSLISLSFFSCLIGASLLMGVYTSFVYTGAKYAPFLSHLAPELMLSTIVKSTFSQFAQPIASLTIVLACLTTIVVLGKLFTEYLTRHLHRLGFQHTFLAFITMGTSFIFSLFGFHGISQFLSKILAILYPAFIALSIGNIIDYWSPISLVKPFFYGTLGFFCCKTIWNFLGS